MGTKAYFLKRLVDGIYLKRDNYADVPAGRQTLASISVAQLNFTGGAGVEFSVTPVNIISLEFRLTSGKGIGATQYKQTVSANQILAAWHFSVGQQVRSIQHVSTFPIFAPCVNNY